MKGKTSEDKLADLIYHTPFRPAPKPQPPQLTIRVSRKQGQSPWRVYELELRGDKIDAFDEEPERYRAEAHEKLDLLLDKALGVRVESKRPDQKIEGGNGGDPAGPPHPELGSDPYGSGEY